MALPDHAAGLLAALVASADDAIVSKDLMGYVTSWNAGAERLFGYTESEMVGQHITRIIPLERHPEEDFVLSRLRAGGSIDHFETVRQRKDGTLIDISLTVSPILNPDGKVVGASKIARDITDRKRMERDAVRLAAIVDSSDDAIVGKDLAGIIETWNIGAERMFGFSAEEAIGQSIAIIIPPDRMDEEARVMTRIGTGERIPHFETLRRTKDGKLVEVSVSVSPILAKNGTVIGASKIARDITEQNRLRHAAAAASRAKDQFLATLSHELRTPLNAVTGYAQMLQKGTIPERDLARAFDVIGRNAEALTRLVNDVLDASRIATGKLRLELQPCDLGKVAEEAIAAILPASRGKSITVTSEIEHGLVVNGDPDRLQQVLWNLLSNAVKFTPDGGSVRVKTGLEGRTARLIVEDTGIGIAPESLPHVSRRFWQADPSHMRLHGGLGLGLALAREFVELHGGRLDVSSEGLGLGARFVVTLPVATVAAAVS